jgi:hypothetical protein
VAELRTCDMILMDSSPLIYLAKAGHLELLLHFASKIYLADEVYYEACGRWRDAAGEGTWHVDAPLDAKAIKALVDQHGDRFQIVHTQLGDMLRRERLAGRDPRMSDAGEMAAASVYDRRFELTGDRRPVLLVYEDSDVPLRFAQKDVHVLSTFGLIKAMEHAGFIESADDVYDAIPEDGRPRKEAVDVSVHGDTEYRSLIEGR